MRWIGVTQMKVIDFMNAYRMICELTEFKAGEIKVYSETWIVRASLHLGVLEVDMVVRYPGKDGRSHTRMVSQRWDVSYGTCNLLFTWMNDANDKLTQFVEEQKHD